MFKLFDSLKPVQRAVSLTSLLSAGCLAAASLAASLSLSACAMDVDSNGNGSEQQGAVELNGAPAGGQQITRQVGIGGKTEVLVLGTAQPASGNGTDPNPSPWRDTTLVDNTTGTVGGTSGTATAPSSGDTVSVGGQDAPPCDPDLNPCDPNPSPWLQGNQVGCCPGKRAEAR